MKRFKSRRIAGALAASFLFSMLHLFGAAVPVAMAELKTHGEFHLSNITKGETEPIPGFPVGVARKITVNVKWNAKGVPGITPNVVLQARLVDPDGTTRGAVREMIVNTAQVSIIPIEFTPSDTLVCSFAAPRMWTVRIKNATTENSTAAEARVTVKYETPTENLTIGVSLAGPFFLTTGNYQTIEVTFSPDVTGTLIIEGVWNTHGAGRLLGHKRLQIRNVKNHDSQTVTLSSGVESGFAQNSNYSTKLRAVYKIRQGDVGPNRKWRFEVYNPNTERIEDIVMSVRFTPAICSN